jgi:hypothetical protein
MPNWFTLECSFRKVPHPEINILPDKVLFDLSSKFLFINISEEVKDIKLSDALLIMGSDNNLLSV